MFFIFSFDVLLYILLVGLYLFMLAVFPVFTLIVTGLIIWGVIAALSGRGGAVDE